ncbi:DUF7344 domain-containing protein [Halapricum salinum]|uniref:DUF7344 domain-containing protein n=1 Tax=Halapricum salinum TaxID=1457250 RepID=UPI001F3AFEA9|nr:hypothetical protein [Halapricum salinum]
MASSTGGLQTSAGGVGIESDQSADEGQEEVDDPLTRDDTFEILSNHRRRFALHHLQQNGDRADLGDLSEHVAAWENDIGVAEVSSSERKRVYTSLQQFHLPKMDEKGVVEFDDREGVVELTAAAGDVDIYLEVVDGNDVPWSQYYLGLAAVNLGILGAALAGLYPFTLVPSAGLALLVVTTFLVSALVHTYFNRTEMRLGDSDTPPEVEG